MPITTVTAVLTVADFDRGLAWYERFFGRPADLRPMDGLGQWELADGGAVQVLLDAGRAGRAVLTLGVDNLDAAITDLNSRGLHVGDVVEGVMAKLTALADPDGNTITLAEAF